MSLTYEEIITQMKNAYFNECGQSPDMMSDLGIRLKSVATELYSISAYGDYILNQAFVRTASGKYLDLHAEQRSILRKKSSASSGILTFSVSEVQDADIEIPSGTVCSVKGKPFIQFATTSNVTISKGNLSVNVAAQSVLKNDDSNVAAGTISVIVNPPASVCSVTNTAAFVGGCEDEKDASLRKRILDSYSVDQNGVNCLSIAEVIKQFDGVLDCLVSGADSANKVNVYIKTASGIVEESIAKKVVDNIGICVLTGCTLNIDAAKERSVSIFCNVLKAEEYSFSDIKEKVKKVIVDSLSNCIGDSISLTEIASNLSSVEGIKKLFVHSPDEIAGEIYCNVNEYLICNEPEVSECE